MLQLLKTTYLLPNYVIGNQIMWDFVCFLFYALHFHVFLHRCNCNTGFTGSGTTCNDINECDSAISPCHRDARCTNTPGSFMCTCLEEFVGDGRDKCEGEYLLHIQSKYPLSFS